MKIDSKIYIRDGNTAYCYDFGGKEIVRDSGGDITLMKIYKGGKVGVEAHDFEALRKKRNEAVMAEIQKFAEMQGVDLSEVKTTFNPNACYCACPEGPCEHRWKGWRKFDFDTSGGEAVCTLCGEGAVSHSLRTGE